MTRPIVREAPSGALSGRCQRADSGSVLRSRPGEHARFPRSRPARGDRRRAAACAWWDQAANGARAAPAPPGRDRVQRPTHRRALGRASSGGRADCAAATCLAPAEGARAACGARHPRTRLRARRRVRAPRSRTLPRAGETRPRRDPRRRPRPGGGDSARGTRRSGVAHRSQTSPTSPSPWTRPERSTRSGTRPSRPGSTPTSRVDATALSSAS